MDEVKKYGDISLGLKFCFIGLVLRMCSSFFTIPYLIFLLIIGMEVTLSLIGLWMAGKEEKRYLCAWVVYAVVNVYGFLRLVIGKFPVNETTIVLYNMGIRLGEVLLVYFICHTTEKLLKEKGRNRVATFGKVIYIIYFIGMPVSICLGLLLKFKVWTDMLQVGIIVFGAYFVGAKIAYIVFLGLSSSAFERISEDLSKEIEMGNCGLKDGRDESDKTRLKKMEQKQLEALLNDMTLDEKVGQMVQIPAAMIAREGMITGAVDALHLSEEQKSLVGSVLGLTGAENLREIQDEFMKRHPHHIPLLLMYDVINGMETIFPIPLGQGCTFSPELVEKAARVAAKEAAVSGLHVTFSPMLDLVRDARWGRVMESTGEDPYLNAELGKAMVRGYQGSGKEEMPDLIKEGYIAGCVKHFAAYGAPLGGREYENVELSERTLREDYFPAYQAAIEEGCIMVMTSFNTLNRIPSSGNKWLMRKILREEMGFGGLLISDYSAVDEMVSHGIAEDSKEAAKLAILAGVDIDMVSYAYIRYLAELVRSGEVEERLVDEGAMRVLKLKNDLGLFENPYKDASVEKEKELLLCREHRKAARELAAKSFVLLKNEQALPLNKDGEDDVALIGPYADTVELYGAWSFPKHPEQSVTIKQGMDAKGRKIVMAQGCYMQDEGAQTKHGQKEEYTAKELEALFEEAEKVAKEAETVVLCLGEHREYAGESGSRADISLPKHQLELLRRVQAVNANVVTVVCSGRPVLVKEVVELSKAVLMAWMPGTEGGNAVADVLYGDVMPEGKLSMCLPRSVGQLPIFYNKFRTGRPNEEGTGVGYIHGYIDESIYPLFPFGYGLTYTEFSYSEVRLSRTTMTKEDTLTASVTVTNIGSREAIETVQLYLTDVKGSVVRPVKMLRGFQKVSLKPGESKEVSFEITEEMLRFYNIDMEFVSEDGEFVAWIGTDSDTKNGASFRLDSGV